MPKNVLLICGSLNQTTQMYQIAQHFPPEYTCYFTPHYADGIENLAAQMGLLDYTVLGGRHKQETLHFLKTHNVLMDERGERHTYDLVITCSDLLVQRNLRGQRVVLVQEGITEPEGWAYHLVKTFSFLPRYIANTATNGLSDAYLKFFVASEGYRDLFIRKGVRPEKIVVTGIPNFDNVKKHLINDFPYRDYVLAATTPLRESLRFDDRPAFLRKCVRIADGRQLIFKLHPGEDAERATREIEQHAPGSLIFTRGNLNDMIANCSVFITQQSSSTFVGLVLGKEVHSNLNLDDLRRLLPIQNGGTSAQAIAQHCIALLQQTTRQSYHIPAHHANIQQSSQP